MADLTFPLPATDENVTAAYESGKRCFHCGGSHWQPGPRGGSSQNLLCGCCGQEINQSPYWSQANGVVEDLRRAFIVEGNTVRDRFEDDATSKYGEKAEAWRRKLFPILPMQ